MSDEPQIFENLQKLQDMIVEYATGARRGYAQLFRDRSAHYRTLALQTYDSTTEQARLEGMGDAFAIAAEIVDVPARLEAVK